MTVDSKVGSPPRMRGKLPFCQLCSPYFRITPADAGKTLTAAWAQQRHGGSPPRMRGKPATAAVTTAAARITPADAGKTWDMSLQAAFCGDHPRGCGENMKLTTAATVSTGSPPRMRGKRTSQVCPSEMRRITPADAGKTVLKLINYRIQKDHPRGCGENHPHHNRVRETTGSPPRMRGKH